MATNNSTSTNLSPNLASALCYVPFIGVIAAVVLFIIEKNNSVRWHAVQSVLLAAFLWILSFVLAATVILGLLVPLVWIAGLIVNLVLAVRTYQGATVRLPVLGDLANKVVKKV
jgi:uncharacterized membrane protein